MVWWGIEDGISPDRSRSLGWSTPLRLEQKYASRMEYAVAWEVVGG